MKKLSILIGVIPVFCLISIGSIAQVSINEDGSPPENCAILDIDSPDKGILIPRVSLVSEVSSEPVADPVIGLMVFNTGGSLPQGIYYWRGSGWTEFVTSATAFTGANYGEIYEATQTGSTLTLSNSSFTGWISAEQGIFEGDIVADTENETADRITVNSSGNYQVDITCSFSGDNNHIVTGSIFKNETRFLRISFYQELASNSEVSASASGIVGLQEGDYLDLRFQSSKNNKDIVLKNVNFRITKIGDLTE